MEHKFNSQLDLLRKSVLSEEFQNIAYEVIEEIEGDEEAFDFVEPILELIELNPTFDFGIPGPFVHFVEQFYNRGYEEKLVQSIQRCPTSYTVWMLNRLINGSEGEQKEYYVNVLQSVLHTPNISQELLALTKEFLALHS